MQMLGVSNFSATTPRAFIQRGVAGATTYRRSQPVSAAAAAAAIATAPASQIAHSMPPEKIEIFKSLEPWVIENVHPLLKPVEKCWQPEELLPDPTRPVDEFMDEVRALRERTKELPDEYFVVLVGDLVTEDGLPTYQSMLNNSDATRDETGSSPSPWAVWNRGWTADENRHGDLLRTYLYLSGRVDMSMIERTVQYLIGAGMNPGLENNPYLGYVYTSFQERATFVSHCNTALLAKEGGDPVLANICGLIAGDEKRHERAYVRIIGKLLEVDPNDAMLAIGKMLRSKIAMPAHLMYDGQDPHLFEHFAFVAHKLGVYTPNDYADIMEFLVGKWGLEKLDQGLKGDGRRERDFVCGLAPRIKKLQARAEDRAQKDGFQKLKFSWIFNREV